MLDRFSRSWDLVKASGSVLMQDKTLVLFPLISAVSVVLMMAAFALPMLGMGVLDGLTSGHGGRGFIAGGHYILAFLFYFCQYFVIFFCNTALVGAAMIRLQGGTPTLGDGFNVAISKVHVILGYAAIAATVGLILRAIQRRVGFIGRIVAGMLGVGWTVATYLVVPVLVARDVGPVDAITESASLLKRTWGENVIGQGGLGVVFGLIYFVEIAACVLLVIGAGLTHSGALIALMVLLAVFVFIATALVHSALTGIYSAALYRYATGAGGTQGFDSHVMQGAFQPAA
jgi:hypothetical protein